jgi:hypothetical protein
MNARSPEVVASSEFVGALPPPLPPSSFAPPPPLTAPLRRALAVPADEQLRLVRLEAKSAGTLKDLRQMVAAWEAVAEKCALAFEEMARLAVFRLEVERDLGAELAQTVRPGRPRKHRPEAGVSRRLPEGVTDKQARAYRQIAAIPAEIFRSYVDDARHRRLIPSSAGARRFAMLLGSRTRTPTSTQHTQGAFAVPRAVFDAVSRIMLPDVCIGEADIPARRRLGAKATDLFGDVAGDVLVVECLEPASWLRALRSLRNRAQVSQAVILLPAEVWASWFQLLHEDDWSVCFLKGIRSRAGLGCAAAHLGARAGAFRAALSSVGTFLH